MTNKFIIITGQTATGKTGLALEYAKKYNGELINCDSRQIYQYLDIITGKDKKLIKKVKIWLYDIVKPNEYFSSFDFVKAVVPVIRDIISRKKTPIIVGGTYLYLKHLLYGVETGNIPPDWKLRKELKDKNVKELQKIFQDLNVQSFNRLNNSEKNNPQRLIRKIEIEKKRHSGLSRIDSGVSRLNVGIPRMTLKFFGLKFKEKDSLRKEIEKRVEERLKMGAVNEVKKIIKMGYKETDPGLKTIGYRQIFKFLSGEITEEEAVKQWINKEVQYAKRQYTFMKTDKNIKWINVF